MKMFKGNVELDGDFTLKVKKDGFILILDSEGRHIYTEDTNSKVWTKREYDSNGNEIYYENDLGAWQKTEFDSNNNPTHHEDSNGYWYKKEYDENGQVVLYMDSDGYVEDYRTKEVETVKMTVKEINEKLALLGVNVEIIVEKY